MFLPQDLLLTVLKLRRAVSDSKSPRPLSLLIPSLRGLSHVRYCGSMHHHLFWPTRTYQEGRLKPASGRWSQVATRSVKGLPLELHKEREKLVQWLVDSVEPTPADPMRAATAGNQDSVLFRAGTAMSAAAVARVGFDGLMAGKRVVIAGVSNKLTVFSTRLASRTMLAKITRKLNS